VTLGGSFSVAAVEWSKLWAQTKTRVVLAICVAGPFVFIAAVQAQSTLPSDTLFGRGVKETGFATPLVVLGFAGLWVLPALSSIVGGDLFAAEDRHGTWATVLTRSCSRAEVFAGKVTAAFAFSSLVIAVLAASSVSAGVLIVGSQPLVDLSGTLIPAGSALERIVLAWVSVLPPSLGFTAMAVLLSVATRSSTAGVGIPVIVALALQLSSLIDGPEVVRRLLMVSTFGAWHGLLTEPRYYRPLLQGAAVSIIYTVASIAIAYAIFRRRDIAG
jgi:ABC-2 type transport system permease protein